MNKRSMACLAAVFERAVCYTVIGQHRAHRQPTNRASYSSSRNDERASVCWNPTRNFRTGTGDDKRLRQAYEQRCEGVPADC